ncbi:MAG: hypothetical protein RSD36_08185 [Terrisporobacter sp.]
MVEDLYGEAHRITKKICGQYYDIDYKTQFKLCLSYLCDKNINKRIEEIMNEVKVSKDEARLLDQVEYYYQNTLNDNVKLNFRLWKKLEKRRIYITSEYLQVKTYVDLVSKELHDKNLIKTF